MTFTPERLDQALVRCQANDLPPQRFIVAFSGGLDSTVLLHALVQIREPVLAVHVDHGLAAESADWADHCQRVAADLGVDIQTVRVEVDPASSDGLEAAAREARYATLTERMQPGDWLLTAHHRDDQAETQLFNLVRGGGVPGLAAMRTRRPFAQGQLVRPLLAESREVLAAYAHQQGLSWLEDPSNQSTRFDRNFLRHEVLPLLASRWPDAGERLARSARHLGEAGDLLDQLALIDLETVARSADRLSVSVLRALPPERQRNALRFALRRLGLPTPTQTQMTHVLTDVLDAAVDRSPVVRWPGTEVRRYRDTVYLLPAVAETTPQSHQSVHGDVDLGAGLGWLRFESEAPEGLAPSLIKRGLELRYREGGEEILLQGQQHTKKLKNLLQEASVVPWMRDRIPLLYCDDRLVAVADLWVSASAAGSPGTAIHWEAHPPLQ